MQTLEFYSQTVEKAIQDLDFSQEQPQSLFEPIRYGLESGGKRLRPLVSLLAYSLWHRDVEKALPIALAHEVFHNFTLLHDDVMDNSLLRRGRPSVMSRFGSNRAILSGDAMLLFALRLLSQFSSQEEYYRIQTLFVEMALDIMRGQEMDMSFEKRDDVSIEEYLEMICLKTAVLIASSAQLGAIAAGASAEEELLLYSFALHLGIAFQLQDDLLDVYGDPKTFGKPIGGDIIEGKKTILYLLAIKKSEGEEQKALVSTYNMPSIFAQEKIIAVTDLFTSLGVKSEVEQMIEEYMNRSDKALEDLSAMGYDTSLLSKLGEKMRHRSF